METRGKVYSSNPPRGRVAVKTVDGFTIIDVKDQMDFHLGDDVRWASGTETGSQTIRNVSKGTDVAVVVLNHWVAAGQLREQLLLD